MSLIVAILLTLPFPDGEGAEKPRPGAPAGLLLSDPDRILASLGIGTPALQVEPERYGPQEPLPLRPDTGKPVRPTRQDTWLYFALGPMRGARNSVWNGLFNTPPLEEALALPEGAYHVRLGVDLSTADWASNDEGGSSRWKAAYLTESFEYNYAPVRGLVLGLRVTAGELGEGDSEPVRVYEGGAQLVPAAERGFGAESVVGRAKYVLSLGFLDAGLLAEVKVPLADEADLLTAHTVDVGLSGIATKRWSSFALHLNGGVVVPIGSPDVLIDVDEADPYVHGGFAAAWTPIRPLAIFGQVEFNTSPFGDVTLWDQPVAVVSVGGRLRLSATLFLSASVGRGWTEESGDLLVSSGIDMTF